MKVLIVDDDPLARERLEHLISRLPGYSLADAADSGRSATKCVQSSEAEILLLDPAVLKTDHSGLVHALIERETPPAIIFTVEKVDPMPPALKRIGAHRLNKPISTRALSGALKKASRPSMALIQGIHQLMGAEPARPEREFILASSRSGQQRIPVQDILFFEADQKYTTVFHLHGELLIEESLRHLEQDLAPHFLRIHRKLLVNTDYVLGLDRSDEAGGHGAAVQLRHTDRKLPVSRRRLAEIRQLLVKGS